MKFTKFAVSLLALVLLASCGGKTSSSSSEEAKESESSQVQLSSEAQPSSSVEPEPSSGVAPLDGYIIPYNNSFSTLTALNDEVIKFKQEDTEKHHFYSLDNTKISDLYEINYIVDGFYHTEKRILFSLQTLKTVVSIKDGEQVKNITITTNGTNKDSLEGLSVNRSDPYSLMIGDEKIGDINTSLELDYVNQLISSASTLLSIPSE